MNRIASKKGRWASPGGAKAAPLVLLAEADEWTRLAETLSAGAEKELLEKAASIAMGLPEASWNGLLEPTPEIMARAYEAAAKKLAEHLEERRIFNQSPSSSFFARVIFSGPEPQIEEFIKVEFAELRRQAFKAAGCPDFKWSRRQADAMLLEAASASESIGNARLALELAELAPKARAICEGHGRPVLPQLVDASRSEALALRPPDGTRELAGASAEPFELENCVEGRVLHAIFAEKGGVEGFATRSGALRLDIGEAALFPSEQDAKEFARSNRLENCSLATFRAVDFKLSALLGTPRGAIANSAAARIERAGLLGDEKQGATKDMSARKSL